MRPFLEKLEFKFDIDKLRNQLNDLIRIMPPVDHIFHSRGWGLVASSKDYRSSFDHYIPFRNGPNDQLPSRRQGLEQNAKHFIQDDWVKTEICTGYFEQVIDQLNDAGLNVRRCRINLLKPLSATNFHKDTSTEGYGACIHIPIVTHPKAIFENQFSQHHLPADGSCYIADISQLHRFRNDSLFARYHMIMAVWDTKGITRHFAWPQSIVR